MEVPLLQDLGQSGHALLPPQLSVLVHRHHVVSCLILYVEPLGIFECLPVRMMSDAAVELGLEDPGHHFRHLVKIHAVQNLQELALIQ